MNPNAKKTKILIIDDELVIRNLLLDVMTSEGYAAIAVQDGLEGIAKARQMEFDVIFSDINMPKMNGLDPKNSGLVMGESIFS